MEQSTPEKTLTAEEVYQTLRSEILTLRIRPGEMLPENMLVSRFGLSRTPIRSIIVRLSQEGLIVQQGRKGNYVSLIDLDMAEQMIFLRLQLEIAAFSHLIRHSDTMLLVHLRENLDEQLRVSTSSEPVEHFYQVDSAFHGMCMEAAAACAPGRRCKTWKCITAAIVDWITRFSKMRMSLKACMKITSRFTTSFAIGIWKPCRICWRATCTAA